MRRHWLSSLGLSLGLLASSVRGEEIQWRPAGPRPAGVPAYTAPVAGPAASLGRPIATLGRPVAANASPAPESAPAVDEAVTQAAYSSESATQPPPAPIARGQNPEFSGPSLAPPPPGFPATPEEKYNAGVVVNPPHGSQPGFWSRAGDNFGGFGHVSGGERGMFQSDHCFDGFISPVTNPFLFEDPRALTELRPIFMAQGAPSSNWIYHGGNAGWFGTQARIAVTERLSFTLNKFGWVWSNPYNPPPGTGFSSDTGFSEIWLGPKYTFLRNDSTGTLGAAGVTFQIPSGPARVFQDTGNLSIVPYVSMGQNFGRTSYGSFNTLGTFGYAFGSTHARSDYLFLSTHLDFDVMEAHKFYPLLELNYFHYTEAGTTRDLGFEGRDLFNFGSQGVNRRNNLTIAPGFRYKFCEAIQAGVGMEFPLVGTRDILDYRVTADMIFRY